MCYSVNEYPVAEVVSSTPNSTPSSEQDLAIEDSRGYAKKGGVDIGGVAGAGERQPPPGIGKKFRASG